MSAPEPFLDWLADKVGTRMWVVYPHLTDRLRAKNYDIALSQARYAALQAEYQTLLDMDRAERIALRLFPDDYFDEHDCKGEIGREGLPCRICADNLERWTDRIKSVADALTAEK